MTTAVFSVFNAMVLRPVWYPNPERLVWLSTLGGDEGPGFVSAPDFRDWRAQAESFDGRVAYGTRRVWPWADRVAEPPTPQTSLRAGDIRAVLLLPGLPSLGGRLHMAATPSLAVFGIHAEQDFGADAMRSVIGVSKHPQSTLKMFPGSGHGVEMFPQHHDLQPATVKWLQDQVSKP